MSELTAAQIAEIRAQLLQRSRELKQEIREILIRSDEQHHKDLAGAVEDAGDAAVADMLIDIDTALVDRRVAELREIESAFQRMAKGIFGNCADCGLEIGYERLAAYPVAARCARCQERYEKNHLRGTTPTL
ncbi:MAG: TraR/DksA family transcriptional regulator [Burkholderiales bacterium]